MLNIRKSLFETNSSSMHSICIQRNNQFIDIPEKLNLQPGEFGWDCEVLTSPLTLGSYLYTALLCNLRNNKKELSDWKTYIYEACHNVGCEVDFSEPTVDEYGFTHYYIDHGSDYAIIDFLDKLRHNEKRLIRFLFGQHSFIITSNDNNGYDFFYDTKNKLVDQSVEEFFKDC